MALKLPFLKRDSGVFGLDIGTSAVKAVQLRGNTGNWALSALGVAPVSRDAISEGTIKEPAVVVEAIRHAVTSAGIQAKSAVIAVAGRELIIKTVRIPEVPPKELDDAVHLEAEHHIPFAIEEVFLDYQIVGRREAMMDLILVAAKKSKIIEYMGVVEEAGLEALVVDVDGFAMGNQYELNHPGATETVALIDIGASTMKTNVLRGGISIFARDIAFGGNNYTQAIAQHLGIDAARAETAKVGRDTSVEWDSFIPALETVSRELALEAQRTFDYLASTGDSEHIGKVVLAGGCSQLPGLSDYLSSTWGAPVTLAKPLERVAVGPEHADLVAELGPALTVAVGLALRQPGDKDA